MTLDSMKVLKRPSPEFHESGFYSPVRFSSSVLLFCLVLLRSSSAMFVSDEEQGDALNDTQDTPSATQQPPCTEVSIDALWLRLDFHNGRLGNLEKDASAEVDDLVASGRKVDKHKRSNSKKLKHNLNDSTTSSSEIIQLHSKNQRPSKRHSIRSSRRHHNRGKKISATPPSPSTILATLESTIPTSTKKSKQPESNKRKNPNSLKKRNSESVEGYSPWLCQMTPYWEALDEDTMPRYIKSGNCISNSSCHQGSYECVPKKYIVKVLKKLKNVCYPVPSTDPEKRLLEEAWIFVDREVTVACECTKMRSPGIYISNPSS